MSHQLLLLCTDSGAYLEMQNRRDATKTDTVRANLHVR